MEDLSRPISENFAELLGNTSSQSGTNQGTPAHTGQDVTESPNA